MNRLKRKTYTNLYYLSRKPSGLDKIAVRARVLIEKSQNISKIQLFKTFSINAIFEKHCGKCRLHDFIYLKKN